MMVEFDIGGFVTSIRTESVIRVTDVGNGWCKIYHSGGEDTLVLGSLKVVAARIEYGPRSLAEAEQPISEAVAGTQG